MRTILLLGALALGAAPLAAQNFVTNGDFANGLTGWTQSGWSLNPGLETFDVDGLGASQCFACSPGAQTYAPPHPPNTIEQQVLVIPSVPLELTADFAITNAGNNADGGIFAFVVAGVEVARFASGAYTAPNVARLRVVARFTTTAVGMQPLKVHFARNYVAASSTPRVRVDNVALTLAPGPSLYVQGNRAIGQMVVVQALGEAQAPVAFFLSPARSAGIQVPGVAGTLFLDPLAMPLFFGATLDGKGQHQFTLTLPTDPYLLNAPVWVQGAMVTGGQAVLGNPQFLTFTQ